MPVHTPHLVVQALQLRLQLRLERLVLVRLLQLGLQLPHLRRAGLHASVPRLERRQLLRLRPQRSHLLLQLLRRRGIRTQRRHLSPQALGHHGGGLQPRNLSLQHIEQQHALPQASLTTTTTKATEGQLRSALLHNY